MRYVLLTLAIALVANIQAQRIRGQVVDSVTGDGIENANIQILTSNRKFILETAVSDKFGYFNVRLRLTGSSTFDGNIVVSHVSYKPISQALPADLSKPFVLQMAPITQVSDEVVVDATRAGEKQPTTFTNISKEEIKNSNLGQDMPMLLKMVPGAVSYSDAGAGIGYTGIRIRGVDPTRINVTVNGIPINDAESQGVFWVNMPDFASSVQNIQVQRGVGSSTNGAAAFGSTVSVQTNAVQQNPYGSITSGFGSFNTLRNNVQFGTGLMENNWSFDGRLSQIKSDGFIDRASSNLRSFYLSGGYYGEKTILRANVFSGKEITYQAWYGIPEPKVKGNYAALDAYANFLGDPIDRMLTEDDRTYNPYNYENEVDNYQQDHYQLHLTHQFNSELNANVSLHYTRGAGYYEQYKPGEDLQDYGLSPVYTGNDTINESDIIRRRWLDNHFYGIVYSANYTRDKLKLTYGGAWNKYEGAHFGEIIWAEFASNSSIRDRYYDNDAVKTDFNNFIKATYELSTRWSFFADVQFRLVNYSFKGPDDNGAILDQEVNYQFVNPKGGLVFLPASDQQIYFSVSIGNREPVRNDFTESSPTSRPTPEQLVDYELGYRWNRRNTRLQLTAYYMDYKDQLILTGEINDVGAYTRVNVPESYRTGVEAEFSWNILNWLQWNATAAISQNKVKAFTEYVDNWDPPYNEMEIRHTNTDLAFSPNTVLGSMLRFKVYKGIDIDIISKYVSRQYLDNTQNANRSLDGFFRNDLRLHLAKKKFIGLGSIDLSVQVNNVLGEKYEPNGYSFSGIISGERYDFNYLYPMAGRNYLAMLTLSF